VWAVFAIIGTAPLLLAVVMAGPHIRRACLEDGELNGMTVIHLGDESGFVAKRAKAQKRPKSR
jgi:hypothetical protein